MFYNPKHSAARKRHHLRQSIAGIAVAASATAFTGIALSPPAQASDSVWDAVANCESSGDWAANTGNSFHGGLQFSDSTWRAYGGSDHAPSANRASRSAQIRVARRVLAAQGPGAWPVCGQRAGLSRASGGTDSVSASPVSSPVSRSVSRSSARVSATYRVNRNEYQANRNEYLASFDVNDAMGPTTTRAIQRWVGADRDGLFGPITTRALQREVGSEADGIIGPVTMRALQVKVGAPRDGSRHMNDATVSAVQTYLELD